MREIDYADRDKDRIVNFCGKSFSLSLSLSVSTAVMKFSCTSYRKRWKVSTVLSPVDPTGKFWVAKALFSYLTIALTRTLLCIFRGGISLGRKRQKF